MRNPKDRCLDAILVVEGCAYVLVALVQACLITFQFPAPGGGHTLRMLMVMGAVLGCLVSGLILMRFFFVPRAAVVAATLGAVGLIGFIAAVLGLLPAVLGYPLHTWVGLLCLLSVVGLIVVRAKNLSRRTRVV